MSILIKDIEMPTSCFECPISRLALGNLGGAIIGCPIIGQTMSAVFCVEKRLDNCALVEIPPHGRLIDADALMNHEVLLPMDGGSMPIVYSSYIRNAPTIIEAEGRET